MNAFKSLPSKNHLKYERLLNVDYLYKMVDILHEAPDGFGASMDILNTFPPDCLAGLCDDAINFLQYKVGAIKADKWCQRLQKTNKDTDEQKVQSVINYVIYLYRAAVKHRLSDEEFKDQLARSMAFTPASHNALCTSWSSQRQSLLSNSLTDHMLGVGQLVDIQWKVGMAVSSDSCRSLNSPFVMLNLTVADTAGQLTTHNLELTMDQFRNFTKQLKEIGHVLETV